MEVAMTTMSQNGQVVIPSEIRQEAKLKPSVKFLVFHINNEIVLKKIEKEELIKEVALLNRIERSEAEIAAGRCIKVDSKKSLKEIDELLME